MIMYIYSPPTFVCRSALQHTCMHACPGFINCIYMATCRNTIEIICTACCVSCYYVLLLWFCAVVDSANHVMLYGMYVYIFMSSVCIYLHVYLRHIIEHVCSLACRSTLPCFVQYIRFVCSVGNLFIYTVL